MIKMSPPNFSKSFSVFVSIHYLPCLIKIINIIAIKEENNVPAPGVVKLVGHSLFSAPMYIQYAENLRFKP